MPSSTRTVITAIAVAAASLLLGTSPADARPAPEPAEHRTPVAGCPRIDALAQQFRTAGFSAQAAQNYAVLVRRDCVDAL
jgi:hypothetical protein